MNDPYTNNPTRAWGHIGQVTHCQNNLEVGRPADRHHADCADERFQLPPPGAGLLLVVLPSIAQPGRERLVLKQRNIHRHSRHLRLTFIPGRGRPLAGGPCSSPASGQPIHDAE